MWETVLSVASLPLNKTNEAFMKKISIFMMALLSMALVSCDEDFAPEVGPQTNPQGEIAPAYKFAIERANAEVDLNALTENTMQLFKVVSENVSTKGYTVVMKHGDSTQELTADGNGNVAVKDLNTALIKLAGASSDAMEYSYFVKSTVNTKIAGQTTDVYVESNTVNVKFVQLPAFVPYIFDTESKLFFTGSAYGWGKTWVPMANVNSHEEISWMIVYLHEAEEIKFAPQQDWGGDFGALVVNDNAGSGIVASADGTANLKTTKAGWYLISVDAATKTVTIDVPKIWLYGSTSVTGQWEYSDDNLFTIPTTEDGAFVSPAFSADGEARMCVKIKNTDWWQTEFIITADGAIDFRAAGGDQTRVAVKKGQKAYLTFGQAQGWGSYK